MTYHEDVAYLDKCSPEQVDRNADEFKRVRDLLGEVEPASRQATRTQWVGEARNQYDARLREARSLVTEMQEAFDTARGALRHYADELATAKRHYAHGKEVEAKLSDLIGTKGTAVTRTAQEAEPMRRWEDMRATTGVLDFVAEIGMDVDDIKDRANSLHDSTSEAFGRARRTEKEARALCLSRLKRAYEQLPEFFLGRTERADFFRDLPDLLREAREARKVPLTHLPGSGPKRDSTSAAGDRQISPALAAIRRELEGLPGAKDSYWSPPSNAAERSEWITANKDVIKAAARRSGLPPDMVAGIAWQEIGGQPGILDDITDTTRQSFDSPLSPLAPENLPSRLGGDPDETSFGPIAIQVRRGAEVLGYDPDHLTEAQRNTVEDALQDPAQNICIASEYLAQLKAESEFADVPAEEMTPAQYQELAARYNGGPYWRSDDAQAYGRGFRNNLDEAGEALK